MSSIGDDAFGFLLVVGECHRRLKQHAIHPREFANVRMVTHVLDIPELDSGFRLEEYVDAELISGEAVSWCLEITVTLQQVTVEADVRRIHYKGQDVLFQIAEYVYSSNAECSQHLLEITNRLWSANPI